MPWVSGGQGHRDSPENAVWGWRIEQSVGLAATTWPHWVRQRVPGHWQSWMSGWARLLMTLEKALCKIIKCWAQTRREAILPAGGSIDVLSGLFLPLSFIRPSTSLSLSFPSSLPIHLPIYPSFHLSIYLSSFITVLSSLFLPPSCPSFS